MDFCWKAGGGGLDLIRRNGRFIKEAAAYPNLRDF